MKIKLRHIGGHGPFPSAMIELIIVAGSATISEDITNRDSKVDTQLIDDLREIADELENQNYKVDLRHFPDENEE